ncbi:hypothetical protein CJ030_MR5G003434 [Morella rubra]|uniref:Nucleic acid-binding proteins superfamily n=1 Tax=Morella rubra TaxID=262757 RepID=A0A6A1VNJ8_9ROSI|nr:hypothetical protein CJ030_MR5G003434 [Morella rubra]
MSSLGVGKYGNGTDSVSAMDVDQLQADEDPFLAFVDYARSALSPEPEDVQVLNGNGAECSGPGWSWITSRILKTCVAYSSGVTAAILLSELSQAWNEQHRAGAPKKRPECMNQLKEKHRRTKLPNTVSIDSIYERNFLSLSSVLETVIVDAFSLPGNVYLEVYLILIVHEEDHEIVLLHEQCVLVAISTNIYMLTLGDFRSSNTIDLYLHRRYYELVDPQNGILKKGREILLTGCYLRSATEGSGCPRLLPTEYLVILLDEEEDDDAMLLGAQFCSDSFSSISLDAVNKGVSFSLYARIESIGSLEIQGSSGSLQRKQITLVDNDGVKLEFFLWGEQVLLANLFSVGSMLALDRPYISSSMESAGETSEDLCLEYGSATQLYVVPSIQHEEQVCVAMTQNRYQGPRLLSTLDSSQDPKVSQVSLPCDSRGSIDFSNFPFRSFVMDFRDKMTGISVYGVVTDIIKEKHAAEAIFSLKLEDTTRAIWAKLHFSKSWSLGRLSIGHTVYISGLTCSMTKQNGLEALWFENDVGSSFFNLSCLPALLSSSCLHRFSNLCDLSSKTSCTRICRVWLDQIAHCHVNTKLSHALCGHFVNKTRNGVVECSFCNCNCDAEVMRTFHLKITLADESAKVFAWCTGQTAAELLQISPDEFYELPEEEQVMYPSSLEKERFMVAVVNCKRQGYGVGNGLILDNEAVSWEISRALKCE